jgi:four helix bundle protein
MKIERFEDIDSWQKARELTQIIYNQTNKGKYSKDFGLRDQIQRAAVSIMANIAEGFDAGTAKSFIVFLRYAYRSASEVQSLLYVAVDCSYITRDEFNKTLTLSAEIKRLIGGFIQYLNNQVTKH